MKHPFSSNFSIEAKNASQKLASLKFFKRRKMKKNEKKKKKKKAISQVEGFKKASF